MPEYCDWDSLFYATWFQPTQINLAYTILSKALSHGSPFPNRPASLHFHDFGCGALATQFGLAIAASELLDEGYSPEIVISLEDSSQSMKDIGWMIWENLIREIDDETKYPSLGRLRQTCKRITPAASLSEGRQFCRDLSLSESRWLSAFHVAYEENVSAANPYLKDLVGIWNPNFVLVTSHDMNRRYAFTPSRQDYRDHSTVFDEIGLGLYGDLAAVTNFRSELYEFKVAGLLGSQEERFTSNYLKSYPTSWVTRNFRSRNFLYTENSPGRGYGSRHSFILAGRSGYTMSDRRDWD